MPDNKLVLVLEVDADRANASIKSVNKGLSSFEQAARNAARGASQGIDGFTVSVAKGAAAGAVLASAFEKVLGWRLGCRADEISARIAELSRQREDILRANEAASIRRAPAIR